MPTRSEKLHAGKLAIAGQITGASGYWRFANRINRTVTNGSDITNYQGDEYGTALTGNITASQSDCILAKKHLQSIVKHCEDTQLPRR